MSALEDRPAGPHGRGVVADSRAVRIAYLIAGHLCLALGVTGIVLPVLPGVVFLIGAAACYARGSMWFYHWLLANKWLGPPVRDWEEHRAMTGRSKAWAISMLLLGVGVSVGFFVTLPWVRILLAAIALGVTGLILSIRTRR